MMGNGVLVRMAFRGFRHVRSVLFLVILPFLFFSFFFFSSRRRHTRYIGDWSSDVCSSDLLEIDELARQLLDVGHAFLPMRCISRPVARRVRRMPAPSRPAVCRARRTDAA